MTYDLLGQQGHQQAKNQSEVVLASIPQQSDDTILQIVMVHAAGGATNFELRTLVWGNGIGWYRQHTLQLAGTAAQNLIQALGVVQRRVECQGSDAVVRKVLRFPRQPQQDIVTA
jgi:hypothetical protein